MKAVKHLLRYKKGTIEYGIQMKESIEKLNSETNHTQI
jgi:hypothetical protein